MSDFNKGDFTQQGVDGHVRATLRLNEKRYVELDLTTNENARGCTISGNVHDRLNNLDYPIGAAPSGNIAITENTAEGEPLNIAQYATATVNVPQGGGGLPTLHANIINSTGEEISGESVIINVKGQYTVDQLYITQSSEEIEIFYTDSPFGAVVGFGGLETMETAKAVTPSFTNLVNCRVAQDGETLTITDSSQSSSATIALNVVA